MIDLTSHIGDVAPDLDSTFGDAVRAQLKQLSRPVDDYDTLAAARARHGFVRRPADLLTPPDANHKLAGAATPSYGLTLHSFRVVLPAADGYRRLSLNACPHAGHCVKVCVLRNGNGRFGSVQRAWLWRTDLLAREPHAFARILAFELVRAVRKHGRILFRPNVNSDIAWETVLPSLTDGSVLPGVLSYGYSKRPETLQGDGWLGAAYRVAYSWNERSDAGAVAAAMARGVPVAMVTSRRKGAPTVTAAPFDPAPVVLDADSTDEWMLTAGGVIGDLSAKGKARSLTGRSGFVVSTP
jgi:hypothetical protein